MSIKIEIFLAHKDNFGYLLHDEESGASALIDAGDEKAILAALERTGWELTDIFITHHHLDHTDAIAGLKKKFNVKVTSSLAEGDKIPLSDRKVSAGEKINFAGHEFYIINLRGHTNGHIGYYNESEGILFTGDALFSLGCGRMFEGTAEIMWRDLAALRELPDNILVYCGHEYSLANAQFALSVDPHNEELKKREQQIRGQLAMGKFTIPTNLGEEKALNPFLRADDPIIKANMGMENASPIEVFAALRKAKDNF